MDAQIKKVNIYFFKIYQSVRIFIANFDENLELEKLKAKIVIRKCFFLNELFNIIYSVGFIIYISTF